MSRIERLAEGVTLYLGDCKKIKLDEKIDAVVADGPYGISHQHHGGGKYKWAAERSEKIVGDDSPFDPTHWLKWPCVLFGADYFANRLPLGGRWLTWDKRRNVCPPRSQSDFELIWCSEPGPRRVCYHMWDGMVRDSEVGIKRVHPTQKPVAVMEWCINFLPPSETILDPYMGCGSTGIAAVRMGRKFVGVEIVPAYFDESCRRIEAALAAPGLQLYQAEAS